MEFFISFLGGSIFPKFSCPVQPSFFMSVMSSPFIFTAIFVGSTCCCCGACCFVWFADVVLFAMYLRIEFLCCCCCISLGCFLLLVFFGVVGASCCCLLFWLVVGLPVVVVSCVCSS